MCTFVILFGAMAERLGTGLQNLLQRFDSAWHLQSPLNRRTLFYLKINPMKRILTALSACLILFACNQSKEQKDIALVGDGSDFNPTAKAIFGDRFDAFMALYSNDDAKKAARAKSILDYAEAHGLDISCFQDFGWPAVSIK